MCRHRIYQTPPCNDNALMGNAQIFHKPYFYPQGSQQSFEDLRINFPIRPIYWYFVPGFTNTAQFY